MNASKTLVKNAACFTGGSCYEVSIPAKKILLNDWGTQKKYTQVGVRNGSVSVAYLSFDVWSSLFDFKSGCWFANVYGEYDDNFVAIRISKDDLWRLPQKKLPEFKDLPEQQDAVEFYNRIGFWELSPEVLRILGVDSFKELAGTTNLVEQYVHAHDNFIFFAEPCSPELLQKFLTAVVQVHEHYLGLDLNSQNGSKLVAYLAEYLQHFPQIEIRSNPLLGTLSVNPDTEGSFWKWLKSLVNVQWKPQEFDLR